MAAHSARQWQQGEEYEDDFSWTAVLYALVIQGRPEDSTLAERLDRLEVVGAETQAPKLAMVKALLAREGRDFHAAFEAAHAAYEEVTERHAKMNTLPRRGFLPHRYVWVEGLALLRLAERAGLP